MAMRAFPTSVAEMGCTRVCPFSMRGKKGRRVVVSAIQFKKRSSGPKIVAGFTMIYESNRIDRKTNVSNYNPICEKERETLTASGKASRTASSPCALVRDHLDLDSRSADRADT